MNHEELCELLQDQGFDSGWVLEGEVLTRWEHEEDPPAPLVRPQTDEPVVDEPLEGEQP
jgi:hypothetical protein